MRLNKVIGLFTLVLPSIVLLPSLTSVSSHPILAPAGQDREPDNVSLSSSWTDLHRQVWL